MTKIPNQKANALLEAVKRYDIRTNRVPEGVFSFAIGTLCIWCTTDDNPGGLWQQVRMLQGQLTKPAALVAYCSLRWSQEQQDLVGLSLQTIASRLSSAELISEAQVENRPEDIAWAKRKLEWLWQQALPGEPMPPIEVEWRRDKPKEDFTDFF